MVLEMQPLTNDEEEGDAFVQWSERSVDCFAFRIRRWFGMLLLFMASTAVFLILFIFYATQNADSTTCRLTYTNNAVVSEAKMQTWAADAKWPLPVPTYDREKKACVCSSDNVDPTRLALTDYVPAWIAPGDLNSMKEDGILPTLPSNIPNTYNETDHVKVCLQHKDLVALWGDDYLGKHCHLPTVNATDQSTIPSVERFFLGYDGALYCDQASNKYIKCLNRCKSKSKTEADCDEDCYRKAYS